MLFDPDDGKTWEQQVENVVGQMPPEERAEVMAAVQASGLSMIECVECAVRLFIEKMEDPAFRAAELAKLDRRTAPFGKDPLLKSDA